jgi:beta-mannanase
MIILAGYVDTHLLPAVMCTALFVGMAHNVHADATCTNAFGSETAVPQGCPAAYNVSDVGGSCGGRGGGEPYRPADPQALPIVQNVLDWLYTLPGKTTKKVMSGQIHANIINDIHNQTGYRPALLGDEFNDMNRWDDFGSAVSSRQAMLDHWNNGGLVSIYMLVGNPKNKTGMRDTDFSDADMEAAVTPGTEINTNYNEYLHTFAVHARWLSDHGVPLMVRPLPEMNCCFWYGRKSFKSYKRLYQYTFDYLTRTENLHNLIFQWGPSAWNGAEQPDSNYVDYYPGDAYVDIVGLDVYKDLTESSVLTSYDLRACPMLSALGKIFAFNEFGPKGETRPSSARADYRKLMTGIKSYCPTATLWMSWSVEWSMDANYNDHVKELLEDPWVINRGDLPDFDA